MLPSSDIVSLGLSAPQVTVAYLGEQSWLKADSFVFSESRELCPLFHTAAQDFSRWPHGLFHLPFPLSCSPGIQLGAGVSSLVSGLLSHGPLLEKMLVFCHAPTLLGRGMPDSPQGSTFCFPASAF